MFRVKRAALMAALLAVICTPSAAAKDFQPGDLRVCGATRCVPMMRQDVLQTLSAFYYGDSRHPSQHPSVVPEPRLGAPYFELRFRNGYVTGIAASARLDRFLSYGVHGGWFRPARWYGFAASAAQELRRLARPLVPLRLTAAAVRKSR
jgi:hypothetical protein